MSEIAPTMYCNFCKAPAEFSRLLPDGHISMCGACHNRYQLREEFERNVQAILDHANAGFAEEALRQLEQLEHQLRSQDHDGWLGYAVLSVKALLLTDSEKRQEGLAIARQLNDLGWTSIVRYVTNKMLIVQTLLDEGKITDAAGELEQGVDLLSKHIVPLVHSLLKRYAKIATKSNIGINERCEVAARSLAEQHGITAPKAKMSGSDLVAILAAIENALNEKAARNAGH